MCQDQFKSEMLHMRCPLINAMRIQQYIKYSLNVNVIHHFNELEPKKPNTPNTDIGQF